jgi:CubicO group peptidase (beta-lactamase class C family)
MMRRFSLCFVLLLVLILPCTAQQYDFTALDRLLQDSARSAGGVSGGIAIVLIKDGQTIYSRGFGGTILSPYTPQRVVPIASATKWLSGAVIMSLVDEGRLRLDDSVGRYLASFTGAKASMTVRQLFSHTSGLPGSFPDNDSYHTDRTLTLQSAVDSIGLRVAMIGRPGEQFSYGGVSMQVAGRIAEIVSGSTLPTGFAWDSLFARRIAQPLGIRSMNYDGFGATDNPQIAGSAQSSAEDYARFLWMLRNGGRSTTGTVVLSQAAVDTMLADQTRNAVIRYTPYFAFTSLDAQISQSRYGVGNWIEYRTGIAPPQRTNSSQGAFGFSPWIDRSRNMIGVMSVASQLQSAMPTYLQIRDVVNRIVDRTTSVQARSQSNVLASIHIAPHPASAEEMRITIGSHDALALQPCTVTLHTVLGNQIAVLHRGTLGSALEIALPRSLALAQGTYIVRCSGAFGTVQTLCVIAR